MRYPLVIFDFDGTLADSAGWLTGVLDEVADRYRFRRPSTVDPAVLRAASARQAVRLLRVPVWRMPWIAAHVRRLQARDIAAIHPFPGVPAALADLAAAGATLAVVSSNAEANVRRVLGETDAGRFAAYRCGVSLFGKARALRAVCRACGVRPADAVYVGDEVRDVDAARRAGTASAAVTWGYATADALRAAGSTVVLDAPADIPARLA